VRGTGSALLFQHAPVDLGFGRAGLVVLIDIMSAVVKAEKTSVISIVIDAERAPPRGVPVQEISVRAHVGVGALGAGMAGHTVT
jgi:hypothetical protein